MQKCIIDSARNKELTGTKNNTNFTDCGVGLPLASHSRVISSSERNTLYSAGFFVIVGGNRTEIRNHYHQSTAFPDTNQTAEIKLLHRTRASNFNILSPILSYYQTLVLHQFVIKFEYTLMLLPSIVIIQSFHCFTTSDLIIIQIQLSLMRKINTNRSYISCFLFLVTRK